MTAFWAIFVGGGVGAALRAAVCSAVKTHYGTMTVNLIGAFLIGVLYEYFRSKASFSPELKAFLMTGLLGGFTTFSTYLLDFAVLLERQKTAEALLYLLLSVGAGFAAVTAGMKATAVLT
ncbi:MAG TPA: fluoride efflux transporter CrcB [Alphaproteobacteria bacterium]|nr:fluoride efflux transporter CrcB [Alphaproteobacteria bacterium]